MPYNTRRKSLSLPSLGIQLPNHSRAQRSISKPLPPADSTPQHPTKRVKRSHDENEPPSPTSSPRSTSPAEVLTTTPTRRGHTQHTPPPSPGDVEPRKKIDTDGINDDIVIAVIEQLEKTGNRPHLIKDLATVLAATNENIAHSANPAALLSSRLSLYLKRSWTPLSPCPIAKELIPVHPRKVFFFLTTRPRMPLPESSDDIITPSLQERIKRLTPSISDPSVAEDDDEMDGEGFHDRSRMSPSPEVELFSPELDHGHPPAPPTPGEPFHGRSNINPDSMADMSRHHSHRSSNRAPSPPLEADERGFTETATAVRARGMSLLNNPPPQGVVLVTEPTKLVSVSEETPEMRYRRDHELGVELFGSYSHGGLHILADKHNMASSPMMHPKHDHQHHARGWATTSTQSYGTDMDADMDLGDAHEWKMMSPENIDIEELDVLFTDF